MNIQISSEKRQRVMANDIVGGNLVAERGPSLFHRTFGEVIRAVPFSSCSVCSREVASIGNRQNVLYCH